MLDLIEELEAKLRELKLERNKEKFSELYSRVINLSYSRNSKTHIQLSEKAKKIKSFIDSSDFSGFGCNKNTVVSLMSLVLEEKLEVEGGRGSFPRAGDCVVILKEKAGIGFKNIGIPYFVAQVYQKDMMSCKNSCFLIDRYGAIFCEKAPISALPLEETSHPIGEFWRYATVAETQTCLGLMDENGLKAIEKLIAEQDKILNS